MTESVQSSGLQQMRGLGAHLLAGNEGEAGHEHVQPGARWGGAPPRAGIRVALTASTVAAAASAAAVASTATYQR